MSTSSVSSGKNNPSNTASCRPLMRPQPRRMSPTAIQPRMVVPNGASRPGNRMTTVRRSRKRVSGPTNSQYTIAARKNIGAQSAPKMALREYFSAGRMTAPCGAGGRASGVGCARAVRHTPNTVTSAAMRRRICKLNEPAIPIHPKSERPVMSDTIPNATVSMPKMIPNA